MIDRKHIGYAPPPTLWTVEKGRIAFFAKVIGLTDPIHTDEAAAKAAGYRGIVAPPTFFFGAESDAGVSMKMIQEFDIDLGPGGRRAAIRTEHPAALGVLVVDGHQATG